MKKVSFIIVSFLVMFSAGSVKAIDITDEGTMQYFTLTDQADIEACNRTDNPTCANSWSMLKTSDNQVVYCYDVEKEWPSSSDNVIYSDDIDTLDAGLIYILENGYPNKTIVDGGEKDRYITQGAIWLYVNGGTGFSNNFGDPEGLLPRMQELVSLAKNSNVKDNINSGIIDGFSSSSNVMTLTSDGKYYISSVIKPKIIGANEYKVSFFGGDILSENGTVILENSNLSANEGFIVRVPATYSGVVRPSVTINTKAQMINPAGNNGFQRVIGLSTTMKEVSKSIDLSINKTGVCVNYVIVGNTVPDSKLTDLVPEKVCYDKGMKYSQEDGLKTRTNCKFNGWYTKDDLTGKWIDGTELNSDLTLYGAWTCPTVVKVPKTDSNTSLIIMGIGFISITCGYLLFLVKLEKIKS